MAAHHHFSFLSLAIFAALLLAGSATGIRHLAGNCDTLLQKACNATLYPSVCYTTLSLYVDVIDNPRKLAIAATSTAVSNTTSLVSEMRNTTSGGEYDVLADCVSVLGDSIGLMSDSIEELQHIKKPTQKLQLSNIVTWMSAARTNQDTCTDGYADLGVSVSEEIGRKIDGVKQLTSIALSLVVQFRES